LDGLGLRSIKIKIIAFALLATLIPSLSMGWLSYRNNRRAIDEKIGQELKSLTSHASRELDLWLRERRYEMKVLASSYEVSENLEKLNHAEQAAGSKAAALRRLHDYLGSVGKKFADYQELFVVDGQGNILASSKASTAPPALVADWLARARANKAIVGSPYWDEALHAGITVIAEPIRSAGDNFLGAMGAKISFEKIDRILATCSKDPSEDLYLMTRKGEILSGSRDLGGAFLASKLDPSTAESLFAHEMIPREFRSFRGADVLGTLQVVPELEWGVVAEKDQAIAYATISRLRNVTLTLISAVLLAIGLAAYLLGLTIVTPLGRLTQGAGKVAGGDLDVNLPIHGHGEVGYLTEVFNEMVARLRKFRDENTAINEELRERNKELRTLSITDSLTGLYNRTRLPELLAKELARSRRHQHPFSLLMVDIDHFKRFNDSHGHQAGDEMLRRFAEILKSSIRSCDFGARYGGEEFLIMLTETGAEGALGFAEKLRRSVEEFRLNGERAVTVSIGAASFPDHGGDVDSIISQADAALYRCKREGRNRVALAAPGKNQHTPARVSSG
jgi:diguanylate cyclase (GGDEF)-like protein